MSDLIPNILQRLLKERAELKRKLKDEKDKMSPEQLTELQKAEISNKFLCNMFYGYSSHYDTTKKE